MNAPICFTTYAWGDFHYDVSLENQNFMENLTHEPKTIFSVHVKQLFEEKFKQFSENFFKQRSTLSEIEINVCLVDDIATNDFIISHII